MANLKEIRNRITSIGSTMQITNAMKMVSAAKLKKAQDAITQLRPYAEKLTELLGNVSATLEGNVGGNYTTKREVKKALIVVITSNRGLCGAYNSSVIKRVLLEAEAWQQKGAQVEVLSIGKKGNDFLGKTLNVYRNESDVWDELSFANVTKVAEHISHVFLAGEFDSVQLAYNRFKNAATQITELEAYLPVEFQSEEQGTAQADYVFEPSKEEIVTDLIPQALRTQLYKAVLDANASEHGARMTAMHKATDNANDLQRELKLLYNKERQAAITKEILEIVGGAEALDG